MFDLQGQILNLGIQLGDLTLNRFQLHGLGIDHVEIEPYQNRRHQQSEQRDFLTCRNAAEAV
jgi:hypothetical protein